MIFSPSEMEPDVIAFFFAELNVKTEKKNAITSGSISDGENIIYKIK